MGKSHRSIYTAFLFGQAMGRDLWQNSLLAPHLLVQAIATGAALLVPFSFWLAADVVVPLLWLTAAATLVHLAFVAAEVAAPAGAHNML